MGSDAQSDFGDAVQAFDRATVANRVAAAEQHIKEIQALFPLTTWPSLSVEKYALGPPDSKASFCYRLEFGSPELGSIRGGSSRKLIIYARQDGTGWFHDPSFASHEAAWEAVRSGFVRAFELAGDGRVAAVDDINELRSGPAVTAKALFIYHPDEVLPIYSQTHVRHFLHRLTGDEPTPLTPLAANRRLLDLVRDTGRFDGWHPIEIMNFLYSWADPRTAPAVVKIAPGEGARLWPECLDGGFICVGWDDVGDLNTFASEDDFRAAFAEHYPYKGNQSTATRKAREVWRLITLEPGDRVIANEGTTKVLAVGTVKEPGYVWRPDRAEFKHTVTVDWDASYARTLADPIKRWGVTTVAEVPGTVWRAITGEQPAIVRPTLESEAVLPATLAAEDQQLQSLLRALERKGQVILYGPPGTGKTYTALRFAAWWLGRGRSGLDPLASVGTPAFRAVITALGAPPAGSTAWWMVANPAKWSWEQLFVDGAVGYRTGRIARNYTRIRAGDLVFCYEAQPAQRIVGIARVTDVDTTSPEPVRLIALTRVAHGPTWTQLRDDPVLALSEPVTNRSQGTLFALTAEECAELAGLIDEVDPEVTAAVSPHGDVGQLTQVTFHPSYGYEDFIEGFKPIQAPGGGLNLRLIDGIFKRVCRAATENPGLPYLVLIDEINRGNLPKIFGELITLLEVDKRGLAVRLPQSGEQFAVPPNVYVLGTMNTADRSIRLLDAALRRRFAFHELLPDREPLEGAFVGKLHLADLLTTLNGRIRAEVGRERQVGHAFFLRDGQPLATEEEFAAAFRGDVLPLLQDYACDDYGLLVRLLGDTLIDENEQVLRDLPDADLIDALYTELQAGPAGQPPL
jgi:5-methylcytosine-specific restriction protein B